MKLRTQQKPFVTDLNFIDLKDLASIPALSWTLTARQRCDLELIMNEGFAPLKTFLGQKDYLSVLNHCRLQDGTLWSIPIMLDVDSEFVEKIKQESRIALRDSEGLLLAILTIEEVWVSNKAEEAEAVFGTGDQNHPGVFYLLNHTKDYYLSGNLQAVALPHHYDFCHLRHTPQQLKKLFQHWGWQKIVGFQTRNPMHRAHQELTLRAHFETGAHILIHPVVGLTKPGDIEYFTRVRCYEHVLKTYQPGTAYLSLLPLAMRMAGPREALWHACIRKNYGCTHFIVGRDHAGPGKNQKGIPFYDPYAAQAFALKHQSELGITIVPFQEMVYSNKHKRYYPIDQFPADDTAATLSGTELRNKLQKHETIPAWFSYPNVIEELQKVHPPKQQQGFTVFFTGLPSSGKSTLANALSIKLREITGRQITLLDGDIVRTHLSQGLGFSREDRELNIARFGYVASEITKHGGIVICALIAPFMQSRAKVRAMVSAVGGFIEVYVATPLTVCENRDRKGLYQKARQGLISQFTGISDPYESPTAAEVILNTENTIPATLVDKLVAEIRRLGYIA